MTLPPGRYARWLALAAALGLPVLLSLLGMLILGEVGYTITLLLMLLFVVLFAIKFSLMPSLLCALSSVLCFNFFFTEPRLTFLMDDLNDLIVAAVFLGVAGLVGLQTSRLHQRVAQEAELQQALERSRSEREREWLRTALTTSLSHDLKTPLATMIGAGTSLIDLQNDLNQQQKDELLQSILSEARRLERYIRNLLDMTRLGYGDLPLDRQFVSVKELLNAVSNRIRRDWPDARLDIRLPDNLPEIEVHPALIEQALYNLMENAVKFTREGTAVSVNARTNTQNLIIDVIDEGPGIPETQRAIVFEFFETLGRGDHHSAGEGLGLSIAKGMIHAHGGRLQILDPVAEPHGTCMRVTLPISTTAEHSARASGVH